MSAGCRSPGSRGSRGARGGGAAPTSGVAAEHRRAARGLRSLDGPGVVTVLPATQPFPHNIALFCHSYSCCGPSRWLPRFFAMLAVVWVPRGRASQKVFPWACRSAAVFDSPELSGRRGSYIFRANATRFWGILDFPETCSSWPGTCLTPRRPPDARRSSSYTLWAKNYTVLKLWDFCIFPRPPSCRNPRSRFPKPLHFFSFLFLLLQV